MLRKLKIEAFNLSENGLPVKVKELICSNIDATKRLTCIYAAEIVESNKTRYCDFFLTEHIERFNIIDGLVTVYYQSGAFIEISRIYTAE